MNIAAGSTGSARTGFVWSLVSALLWSTTFVVVRGLLIRGAMDPLTLTAVRFSVGCVILFAAGMLTDCRRLFDVTWGDRLRLMVLSTFGITGMGLLLFYGQARTDAGTGSLIMSSCPILILLLGPIVGERITLARLIGVGVGMLGCLFVMEIYRVFRGGDAEWTPNMIGNLLVCGSAASWAIYGVFSRKVVQRVGGLPATSWAMLFGAAQIVIIRVFIPTPSIWPVHVHDWVAIAYLAAFPTALAFLAWYAAMETISLSLLNVMQYITPLGALILARFFLGEDFTIPKVVGGVLILVGIGYVQYHEGRPPAHQARCPSEVG